MYPIGRMVCVLVSAARLPGEVKKDPLYSLSTRFLLLIDIRFLGTEGRSLSSIKFNLFDSVNET